MISNMDELQKTGNEIIIKCSACYEMNYFTDVCDNCPDGTVCDNCDKLSLQ